MDKIINFENKKKVYRIFCIKIIDFLPFCMLETKTINIETKNVYCTYTCMYVFSFVNIQIIQKLIHKFRGEEYII